MREEHHLESGVIYVGPRAFAGAFVAVCMLLGALVYGAPMLVDAVSAKGSAPGAIDVANLPAPSPAPSAAASTPVVRAPAAVPVALLSPRATRRAAAPDPRAVRRPHAITTQVPVARAKSVAVAAPRLVPAPRTWPRPLAKTHVATTAQVRAHRPAASPLLVPLRPAALAAPPSALGPRSAGSASLLIAPGS